MSNKKGQGTSIEYRKTTGTRHAMTPAEFNAVKERHIADRMVVGCDAKGWRIVSPGGGLDGPSYRTRDGAKALLALQAEAAIAEAEAAEARLAELQAELAVHMREAADEIERIVLAEGGVTLAEAAAIRELLAATAKYKGLEPHRARLAALVKGGAS